MNAYHALVLTILVAAIGIPAWRYSQKVWLFQFVAGLLIALVLGGLSVLVIYFYAGGAG